MDADARSVLSLRVDSTELCAHVVCARARLLRAVRVSGVSGRLSSVPQSVAHALASRCGVPHLALSFAGVGVLVRHTSRTLIRVVRVQHSPYVYCTVSKVVEYVARW